MVRCCSPIELGVAIVLVGATVGSGGCTESDFVVVPQAATLKRVSLATVDPLAVCVDGSPSAYYWQEAPPAHGADERTIWLVNLQGGGWCHSEEDCSQRCPVESTSRLCSSKAWSDERELQGLFHPKANHVLEAANKVFVPYCTSDAHMGDGEAFGRQFRGQRVLQAVLTDLVKRRGLGRGKKSQDLLILGGQSAGGRGAMVHLDYVAKMLGHEAARNVEVVGLLDSPLYLDLTPYPSSFGSFEGFGKECQGVFQNFNVTHVGSECIKAHPNPDDAWKCIMGEYRMPHVKTPYLIVASQYDLYQLYKNWIFPFSQWNRHKMSYARSFAIRTTELMQSLRASWPPLAARQNAVFSCACYDHASSLTPAGFDERTCGENETSLGQALQQFLGSDSNTDASPPLQWIDTCQGFACGNGCRLR